METCCICLEAIHDGEKAAVLTKKGSDCINAERLIAVEPGEAVRQKCRKDLCRPMKKNATSRKKATVVKKNAPVISRRSVTTAFEYKENYVFCGLTAKYDGKKRGFDVITIKTQEFQNSIAQVCKARNDEWWITVLGRIEYALDLCGADAMYHQAFSVNFRTGKQIPHKYVANSTPNKTKRLPKGRPEDAAKNTAFLKVAHFVEENDEKMEEFLQNSEEQAYSGVYMKKKLRDHFGDRIVMTTTKKQANIVTLQSRASSIINEFYSQPKKEDCEAEKTKIIKAAANLIKSDFKKINVTSENFPSSVEMSSIQSALDFVLDLLELFLRTLFVGKDVDLKVASIGQAIMQAVRPRVLLAPLHLGLGIQMHHHFGSKFLIDSLHTHGFCSSYATVLQYERNAAVAQGTDLPSHISDQFIQYVADNVDHNTRTLDGKGTFHGMGIIATITPGGRISKLVPKKDVSPEELAAAGEINICHYRNQAGHTTPLFNKELKDLRIEDASPNLDLIWKMTPGWLGFMQMVCEGHYPGQSTIGFLSVIDLQPAVMTCVYSTLSFICDHAKRYSVTPIVTFDQPLWWKAMIIVTNEPESSDLKSVVLRLGGLHIEMSFLGCIGHVMSGSGLKEVLELVYATNAVGHMLSGKALARAVRGHFLVDSVLNALLVNITFGSPLPATIELDTETGVNLADKEGELNASDVQAADQDLKKVEELYKELVKDTTKAKQVGSTEVLLKVAEKLESKRVSMHNQRTATMWIQYMNMVDTLRTFIKAERTGNWNLHLQTVREMLLYFAAAGQNKIKILFPG